MKKTLVLILSGILFLFVLVGCNAQKDTTSSSNNSNYTSSNNSSNDANNGNDLTIPEDFDPEKLPFTGDPIELPDVYFEDD